MARLQSDSATAYLRQKKWPLCLTHRSRCCVTTRPCITAVGVHAMKDLYIHIAFSRYLGQDRMSAPAVTALQLQIQYHGIGFTKASQLLCSVYHQHWLFEFQKTSCSVCRQNRTVRISTHASGVTINGIIEFPFFKHLVALKKNTKKNKI